METNDMKINRLLLSTDFDHAFDRVSHAYLWKVMEKLNFSPAVVNIFNGIYKEASSSLQINNCSNLEIEIKCGVRQGCPLSTILFAISLEPLLHSLKEKNIKALAYADDLSMILHSDKSVKSSKQCNDEYCSFSNAVLNIN